MGWKLAKDARDAGLAGTISDRARLALDHMCWSSRDHPSDTQPAAEYFEGSAQLGRYLIGLDATEEAYRKAADRALKELREAGHIELIKGRGGRQKNHWRILIGDRWAPATAVDNYPDWGCS